MNSPVVNTSITDMSRIILTTFFIAIVLGVTYGRVLYDTKYNEGSHEQYNDIKALGLRPDEYFRRAMPVMIEKHLEGYEYEYEKCHPKPVTCADGE